MTSSELYKRTTICGLATNSFFHSNQYVLHSNQSLNLFFTLFSGKRFVFDIQRTLKEANDYTRRQLHRLATNSSSIATNPSAAVPLTTGGSSFSTNLFNAADCSWLPVSSDLIGREGGRSDESGEVQEEAVGSNLSESRQRRHSWSSSSGCVSFSNNSI